MNFINELPAEFIKDAANKGKVERFEYDTFTYDEADSKPMHKGAWVYVPYGYDNKKQYDVLYLLHGGGVNEDWWFVTFPDTVKILDNMIEKGICRPCIIVAPTYYRNCADNSNAEYVTENFHKELRKDLIPAVESAYCTYANGDVTEGNLIATRDHRAIAGLSLGSMTTYRSGLYNNYDMFAWYGPFSGCCGPKGDHPTEVKRIVKTISEGVSKGYPLRYMLCCNGDADIAYGEQMDIMTKAVSECPELKLEENYHFFVIPGGVHDMNAWQLDLYHALQSFFE